MSNSLDPDQARRFVGPDLGQNCLQRLSADGAGKELKKQADKIRMGCWIIFSLFLHENICCGYSFEVPR